MPGATISAVRYEREVGIQTVTASPGEARMQKPRWAFPCPGASRNAIDPRPGGTSDHRSSKRAGEDGAQMPRQNVVRI